MRKRRPENENLQDGAEMSFAAIGQALGMTSQNAFRIYHRAMLKLRAQFERLQVHGTADISSDPRAALARSRVRHWHYEEVGEWDSGIGEDA